MRRRQRFAQLHKEAEARKVLSEEDARKFRELASKDVGDAVVDAWDCALCERHFKSAQGLKVHNARVHK